jgi:hypothetical protein
MRKRWMLGIAAVMLAGNGALAQEACPGAALTSDIPHEVARSSTNYTATSQAEFDCFSWQSLVALNWPAKAGVRGEPDTTMPFGEMGADGLLV